MPFVIALAGAIAAVLYWMYRARAAGQVATELADAAADVLNAARRFGFRRQANQHPVESIDKPELAVATIALAFLELDALPSADHLRVLSDALARQLQMTRAEVDEVLILGRWLMGQCKGPQPAIERVSKRLFRLNGTASLEQLMTVLNAVALAGQGLSPRQKDALEEIARNLRLR